MTGTKVSSGVPKEIVVTLAVFYALTIANISKLAFPGSASSHPVLSLFSADFASMGTLALVLSGALIGGVSVALGETLKRFYKNRPYSVFQFYIDYFKGKTDVKGAELRFTFPLILILNGLFLVGNTSFPEIAWWIFMVIYFSWVLLVDWLTERGLIADTSAETGQ